MTDSTAYNPNVRYGLTFHDATRRFQDGTDSPSQYLERCIETIAQREPEIQALAASNPSGARQAAHASTARWQTGNPLSPIDGMPIGIKDLLETRDMPTEMGCKAFKGNFPKRDNAAVWALREAGAVILAKTVTAELGGSHPGPTRNPFDTARSPGGSSSGSAAAVAAGMMPAAIGTQVAGSIIRPAAYCGNIALKPGQGAINRGERMATSMSTHGVHTNCFEDMWQVAFEIASRAGGDRGDSALAGPPTAPAAKQPKRLIVLETEGWAYVDTATRTAFEDVLKQLDAAGTALIRRDNNCTVGIFESELRGAQDLCLAITAWENRWNTRNIVNQHPDGVSERTLEILANAEAQTPADYEQMLFRRRQAQTMYHNLAEMADAIITLSCPGPAPVYVDDAPGTTPVPRPTGNPVFNCPSSLLFAPAVTVPLLAVRNLPVGIQIMGQRGDDALVTALARWMHDTLATVSIE